MNRLKTLFRWGLYGTGLVVIFLAILVFAVPHLLNIEVVRDKINLEASRAIDGEIRFEKIKLSIYPLPHLAVYKGRFSIPQVVRGKLDSLTIYPKVIPLFSGNLKIGKVSLNHPEFDIRITSSPDHRDKAAKPLSDVDVKKEISIIIRQIQSVGDDLDLQVQKGRVTLWTEKFPQIRLDDIFLSIKMPKDLIRIKLSCRSNFYQLFTGQGEINLKTLSSLGQIELAQLQPQFLTDAVLSPEMLKLGRSELNLICRFKSEGLNVFQGDVQGGLPKLVLQRGSRKIQVDLKQIAGSFYIDRRKMDISLVNLQIVQPEAKLSGRFVYDKTIPRMEIEVKGKGLDVREARKAALALYGDISLVNEIFDILRGGYIPQIRYATSGSSGESLGIFENMTIEGHLTDGDVLVPGVNITVNKAEGRFEISDGLLWVREMRADYGQTRATDGSLHLGFSEKDAPFQLDVHLDGDIGQMPDVLRKFVRDQKIIAQLNRIQNLAGRAQGRLMLGDRLDDIDTNVSIDHFTLTAGIDFVPFPLQLEGRGFSFDDTSINIRQLTGDLNQSSFFMGPVGLNWGKKGFVQVDSGRANLQLSQIHSLLSSFEQIKSKLSVLESLEGAATISDFHLKGPLLQPADWQFSVSGSARNVNLKTERLPTPLSIDINRFAISPQVISFSTAVLHTMDMKLKMSGSWSGFRSGNEKLQLNVDGMVGEKANLWLLNRFKIPTFLLIRPPIKISSARLNWQQDGRTTIVGGLNIHQNLDVFAEVEFEPKAVHVKQFVLQDEQTKAEFSLNLQQRKVYFEFKGLLQKSTVDKFLANNGSLLGSVKGDLKLEYQQDQPMKSVFTGNLIGKDIVILRNMNFPIHVNRISVEGQKNKFLMTTDATLDQDQEILLNGEINYSPKGIIFDANMNANDIVLDRLADKLDRSVKKDESGTRDNEDKEKFWKIPVSGNIRIDTEMLSYQKYKLRPFRADIILHPEEIKISVERAELCGISTPGMINITPGGIMLWLNPLAAEEDFQTAAACLTDKDTKVMGKFSFAGKIMGQGTAETLMDSLRGDFKLNVGEGRILSGRSFRTLRDILALINITEIYKGQLPRLTQEGFAFHAIDVKGRYENKTLLLEEGFVDGHTLNVAASGDIKFTDKQIDLKVLVAPLKTVDSIVSKIPLIGYVLGGSLISIPVSVTGDMDKPDVKLMPPGAVGEGLLGIMKRTLRLPVKLIEPIVPGEKDK